MITQTQTEDVRRHEMYSILNTNVRKSVQEVVNIILVSLQAGTKAGTQAPFYVSFSLIYKADDHIELRLHLPLTSQFLWAAPLVFFYGHFDGKNRCATHFAYHKCPSPFKVLLWTASRPVSITTIPWRACFMTPATRQRQCTVPPEHDSLDWFMAARLSKEVHPLTQC